LATHNTHRDGLGRCTVVVVGGSSGIGEATARLAQERGAQVTIGARDRARLEAAAERVGATGVAVDLAREASVRAFFEQVGPVDHVVVTAADVFRGGIREVDLAAAQAFVDVRFWGPIHVARAARFREGGSLTLVSGTAGWKPRLSSTFSEAVVGAVEPLTRALAVELAPLRVNAVSPGMVRTPRTEKSYGGADAADRRAAVAAASLPVGRAGSGEALAAAILALATNPYVTGEVLRVDGGDHLV
jgi:NAD(P)-dependent dehydrogenase (short-subunit alcohol dehydrogenase family)